MRYLFIIFILFLVGCDPAHTVADSDGMVIYAVHSRPDGREYGRWEYHIKDASSVGWKLYTDKRYDLGDRLIITKAP